MRRNNGVVWRLKLAGQMMKGTYHNPNSKNAMNGYIQLWC